MNNNDYPNRDALRKANDIYLDVMRSFIVYNLRQVQGGNVQQLIEDVLYDNQIGQFHQMLDEHDDIGLAIDFTYIPHIIKIYWEEVFAHKFDNDLVAQNMLWIIRKGRNKCEHRANDLDIEFAQTNLFLISDILKIINRSDQQNEVLKIRNELLSADFEREITELADQIKKVETEKKEYKSQYLETNRQLEEIKKEQSQNKKRIDELLKIKEEKEELEKANSKLSQELKETEDTWNMTDMSLKSKEKQLADEIKAHESLKEHVSTLNEQIEATENENNRYKTLLADEKKTNTNQLESMSEKYAVLEKETGEYKDRLIEIEKQLHISSFAVFPSYDIDSSVRILDRRNTDRKSYLTNLLELNQSSIIYVDCEEKSDVFFKHIAGEKADSIGRHNDYSSDADESELLDRLANGDLIAVVSSATFSTIPDTHAIEHFVFCYPILDLDEFCKQCQQAFMPTQNAYLHLIYDTKQGYDSYKQDLNDKHPDRDTLKKIYNYVKEHGNTNGKPVNLEKLCQDLDMKITVVETGTAIFEELQFVERDNQDIKLLESENRQLEDSKIYSEGKKLREKVNRESFQLGMDSIEEIWEKILDTLDTENKQTIHEQDHNFSNMKNGNQSETTTKTTNESENTAMVNIPNRSQAIVTEEQVNVIRLRSAAGEPLSILSKEFGLSSTAILSIVNLNPGTDVD